MKTDLFIIGSGPGGYRAADYARRQGLSVVIAEAEHAGGTCLNCGCIPTKTLCHYAELLAGHTELAQLMGQETEPAIDFHPIAERKNEVVRQLRSGVEQLLGQEGITLLRGRATLVDAHHVAVADEIYEATNIIIATGSSAKMPPIEGIDAPSVLTSTELLNLQTLPKRLCIVGAGVIGMEFASCMAAFGVKVTVVEFLKECLPAIDGDIAKRLRKQMERRGIDFYMQAGVKSISNSVVTFEQKGKTLTVEADKVLIATGRKPNIEGLNLEAVGIETYRGGILVNDQMQTNIPHIYAIGDVNGRQLLAHAATMQGFRAVNHIVGKADQIQFNIMPAAVFTLPEVASVENSLLTTAQTPDGTPPPLRTLKGFYRANGKALAMNETEGLVKLIVDEEQRIAACHVMGPHAADMIQEVAVLMNSGATLQNLRDIVHTHPTLAEILQEIALQA